MSKSFYTQGTKRIRSRFNTLWLRAASAWRGQRPLVSTVAQSRGSGARFSFQRLHVGANSPTGPGAGAGAGALAYLASQSQQSSSLHGSTAAAAGGAMANSSSREAGLAGAAAGGLPAKDVPAVPWWTRYTRWRQTSRQEGKDAEYKVMRLFPGPAGPMQATDVPVGPGREDFLHTLSGGQQGVDPPVVMMPGYGAGVGFYYRNFPSLAQRLRLFAVDWLGTGLSGRPAFRAKGREQAEDFFINSLVEWRRAAGLDGTKMILVGHSLGGYLAATYALRHPEHVQHLVLVCPAGVPKAPEDWERLWLGDKWSWRGQLFKVFMRGWEAGITPGSIIRGLGPWGQSLVYKYVANRFSHHGEGLSEREIEVFKQYFYHIAAARGSGEYALRHLLAPGAWAYSPLEERLSELQVPVTFIYGKHDWMRPEHAVRLCEQLRRERAPRAAHDLSVEIINDAGHFVFMDQPELFDKALTAVVAPYLKTASERSSANAYAAAGTDVHVAPEAAGSAAARAGDVGGAAATSWGFAASGARGPQEAREEEALDAEGVQLEVGEEEEEAPGGARPAAAGAGGGRVPR